MTTTLTPRQVEFLALAAQGYRQVDIAEACFLSHYTVRENLKDARDRLGARTITQAVIRAIALEFLVLHHDGSVDVARHEVPVRIAA